MANVLYLENPVGTGYSYTTDTADQHMNDEMGSKDNANALLDFLRIHPQV